MTNPPTSSSAEREKHSSSVDSGHPPPLPMTHSGYPPQGAYGGYPPQGPYGGYPDPSYQQYPHQPMQPQGMNNTYYTSPHFPHIYSEPKRPDSLARGFLSFLVTLVIVVTTISILFWAFFGTRTPRFALESMFVPSFEITNSTVNAAWEANVSVYNPNKNINASFEHTEGRLMYQDYLIDGAMVDPILHLKFNEGRSMNAKFAVPSADYGSTVSLWFNAIEEDRKKGMVRFSLRFATYATFASSSLWSRRETSLVITCDDILVEFLAPTGAGKWNGSKKDCYITV